MGGKYRFRTGKNMSKCRPSKSASRMHSKKYGYSGSKAHKRHAASMYVKRVARIGRARAMKMGKRMTAMV